MRNRQNRWLWVIGLLLFLGVATHWGFQLYVKARLDELIRQARPQLEKLIGDLERIDSYAIQGTVLDSVLVRLRQVVETEM